MDRYAVIGHPVEHSLSPRIHAAFAEQSGEWLEYGRIDPGSEGFADAMLGFFSAGGKGLNVTVPFKGEAYELCGEVSARARRAAAVNTLSAVDGEAPSGDNTDGSGLVRDLVMNMHVAIGDARILLLGAGGAVRGVLSPLLDAGPAEVVIANRTADRAHSLATDFSRDGPVRGAGLDPAEIGDGFDILINATAASLGGSLPPLGPSVLRPGGVVYDMMYGPAARPFLEWGRAHGAGTVADGLGMLVEQAAESFRIWRGLRPDTAPVLAALRDSEYIA